MVPSTRKNKSSSRKAAKAAKRAKQTNEGVKKFKAAD
jgi:hypothetical protein